MHFIGPFGFDLASTSPMRQRDRRETVEHKKLREKRAKKRAQRKAARRKQRK